MVKWVRSCGIRVGDGAAARYIPQNTAIVIDSTTSIEAHSSHSALLAPRCDAATPRPANTSGISGIHTRPTSARVRSARSMARITAPTTPRSCSDSRARPAVSSAARRIDSAPTQASTGQPTKIEKSSRLNRSHRFRSRGAV